MCKPNRLVTLMLLTIAALVVAGAQAARAAPQLLGLVSTGSPVELNCHGGECDAAFSTFCLQPDRYSPEQGTAYELVPGTDVELTGITADGDEIPLSTKRYLAIESTRVHMAVRISMSQAEMAALGIARVAVTVGKYASLLPTPVADDPTPHSPEEIAVVTGPLRRLGAMLVDGNDDRMVAARITRRMINGLGRTDTPARAARQSLWRDAVRAVAPGGLTGKARGFARGAVDFCEFGVSRGMLSSLRRCLQTQHDGFLNFLNADYWKAVKTGS